METPDDRCFLYDAGSSRGSDVVRRVTAVSLAAWHPPNAGFGTVENERSLVLLVRHAGHSILLTGDLEKSGTGQLLGTPGVPVDVLLAPHHGSLAAFPDALRAWCHPKLVVVSRADLYSNTVTDGVAGVAVPVWDTHTHGTVTVRSHRGGLIVETFRSLESRVLVRGGVK